MTDDIVFHDFYEPELILSITPSGDDVGTFRVAIEADPGAPGQSVELSRRTFLRLANTILTVLAETA